MTTNKSPFAWTAEANRSPGTKQPPRLAPGTPTMMVPDRIQRALRRADRWGLLRAMELDGGGVVLGTSWPDRAGDELEPARGDDDSIGVLTSVELAWKRGGKWHTGTCPRNRNRAGDPVTTEKETISAQVVERIAYVVRFSGENETEKVMQLETDIAAGDDRWVWPNARLLMTAEAGRNAEEAAAWVTEACWNPHEERVSGLRRDERENRIQTVHDEICRATTTPSEAANRIVARRLRRHVLTAVPADTRITATLEDGQISVEAVAKTDSGLPPAGRPRGNDKQALHVLVAPEGDGWNAQALNADYAACGTTAADAVARFRLGFERTMLAGEQAAGQRTDPTWAAPEDWIDVLHEICRSGGFRTLRETLAETKHGFDEIAYVIANERRDGKALAIH